MPPKAHQLLKHALAVTEKDLTLMAGVRIESLHRAVDPNAEEAWDAEIQRRIEDLDSGRVETIPWSEVRHRLGLPHL